MSKPLFCTECDGVGSLLRFEDGEKCPREVADALGDYWEYGGCITEVPCERCGGHGICHDDNKKQEIKRMA